jgi:hypothetical protein
VAAAVFLGAAAFFTTVFLAGLGLLAGFLAVFGADFLGVEGFFSVFVVFFTAIFFFAGLLEAAFVGFFFMASPYYRYFMPPIISDFFLFAYRFFLPSPTPFLVIFA